VSEVIGAVRGRFNPAGDFVVVEGHPNWHVGVVGIVATRVLQEFGRPTIIFGGDAAEWRGSGRSIAGFDLAAALRECKDLLLRHGGHAMAAGVSMHPEKLDDFRRRLNECARRLLKPEDFRPLLRLDGEVTLDCLTLGLLKELERLEHTGMGNPPVQLVVKNVTHQRPVQRLGPEQQHAKLWLTDGTATREALIWGVKDKPLPEGRFDVAFVPQLNAYNGRFSVQLKVLDWS
jgi:single-stranded-DNA-specific exonuclease